VFISSWPRGSARRMYTFHSAGYLTTSISRTSEGISTKGQNKAENQAKPVRYPTKLYNKIFSKKKQVKNICHFTKEWCFVTTYN
jgi:hypothetical protein